MDEQNSFLAFQIERKSDETGDKWTARDMRVYSRNRQDGDKIEYSRELVQAFKKVGSRIAVVQRYREGMHEKLNVDAVVEVDAPNLVLVESVVFEQTRQNTKGMTLTGNSELDKEKWNPKRSNESVMMISGGEFVGPLQAGFTPGQEVTTPIGKILDNRPIQLKVIDLRLKHAIGILVVAPVSRL